MRRKKNIIDDIALRMRFEEVSDDAIIAMIQEYVQDLEMGDRDGRTLLLHAAFLNRRSVTEWLVEQAQTSMRKMKWVSRLFTARRRKGILRWYRICCSMEPT